MGKVTSAIKNTLLGVIALALVHLSYRLLIMCNEITEMNGLMRNLYLVMKAIAKKWRIDIP